MILMVRPLSVINVSGGRLQTEWPLESHCCLLRSAYNQTNRQLARREQGVFANMHRYRRFDVAEAITFIIDGNEFNIIRAGFKRSIIGLNRIIEGRFG